MQRILLTMLMLTAVAAFAGCSDGDDSPTTPTIIPVGTYTGTYTRIDGHSSNDPATTRGDVTLEIGGDWYAITGTVRYAPPYGSGTVTWGSVATFTDEAIHTAEFDWSLIIDGDFTLSTEGGRIVLEQRDTARDRLVRIDVARVD